MSNDKQGLREVEAKILKDIETAEKGLVYFRKEWNDHMEHVTKAEKKVLENVLGYVRKALED